MYLTTSQNGDRMNLRTLGIIIFATLMILLPKVSSTQPNIPVYNMDILNTYPHSTTSFTQGLFFYNGFLFEGTGQYGSSSINKINLENGQIVQSVSLDKNYFGEGITVLGDNIYQLSWRSHKGFVYDLNTFELKEEFFISTEGWGLTTDGSQLIQSDGSNKIYFLNPDNFKVTRTLYVWSELGRLDGINELEWYKGDILANVYPTSVIARIDAETGEVKSWIVGDDLLNQEDIHDDIDVLNGIAYDKQNDRLFITGKNWPKLFEVELYQK